MGLDWSGSGLIVYFTMFITVLGYRSIHALVCIRVRLFMVSGYICVVVQINDFCVCKIRFL